MTGIAFLYSNKYIYIYIYFLNTTLNSYLFLLSLTNQTMVRIYTSPKVEMLEENGKYTDGGDFKPMKLAHHAADGALFGTYVPPTGSTITHYTAPTV